MAEIKQRAVIWCAVSSEAQARDGKESLPGQEADCRAYCERADLEVIDVLHVPGFSRFYDNFDDCAEEMEREGIYAFNRLRQLWEASAFDVLVARDAERLSRTLAMLAQIIGRVIKSGARIYLLQGGEINSHNRLWAGMMGGFKAESHIDFLVNEHKRAMHARTRAGLPNGSHLIMSHKLLRDPRTGKPVKLVPDESRRPLWDHVAQLIIEGIPWADIENELYTRWGHTTTRGEPWNTHRFYNLIHTPTFWGNSAEGHAKCPRGEWIFEAGHPIPEGVTIYYGTHEAIWPPDAPLTPAIRAELLRRMHAIRGHASPRRTYRFSGLFLCGQCGYTMNVMRSGPANAYAALVCITKYRTSPTRPHCPQHKYLPFKRAQAWLDARLREAIDGTDLSLLLPVRSGDETQGARIAEEIRTTERTLSQLILDRAAAEPILRDIYDASIHNLTATLKALRASANTEALRKSHTRTSEDQQRALQDIASLSIEQFWQEEERFINQTLLRLLGNRRLVALDGQIVGTAEAPTRRPRPPGT